MARWTKQDQEIHALEYLVKIAGTTDADKFFTIIIDPNSADRLSRKRANINLSLLIPSPKIGGMFSS